MAIDINLSSLHALEIKTLRAFSERPETKGDGELAAAAELEAGQLRRAVEWLLSKALLGVESESCSVSVLLSDLGKRFLVVGGTPESEMIRRAGEGAVTLNDLQADERFGRGDWGSAFGGLKKEGVIDNDGANIVVKDSERASFYAETIVNDLLGRYKDNPDGSVPLESFSQELGDFLVESARGPGKSKSPVRLSEQTVRSYALTDAGRETLTAIASQNLTRGEVSRLTPEMIQSGAWNQVGFRRYDLSIKPPRIQTGRHHPYRAYLDTVRRKLLSLGFEEMKGPLVETEFWNMDALYMPQFHAARNIHDAYYVKEPTTSREADEPFFTNVARSHRDGGGTGSRGWRYSFDPERSRRLILRSQGTALSARTLAQGPNNPGKYFGIARCFRHDDVDATHAADFFQVEGIVLGESITFRNLLGLLKLFAIEVAESDEVRYVPDYFPFTEPSVELQAKHPTLGWIELGGAGLFRPELTHPLGVDVPIIAWGLGVDRMAMVSLGIDDIRDLFTSDLDALRNQR